MIQVAIANDVKVFQESLYAYLQDADDIEVVGAASNGKEMLKILRNERVDVLITDVRMPIMDGIEIARQVRLKYPNVKILMITQYHDRQTFKRVFRMDVEGCISKGVDFSEFSNAINTLVEGKIYDNTVLAASGPYVLDQADDDNFQLLTKREMEVLELIVAEYSNSEIARRLNRSVDTITTHRKNIMTKLGLKEVTDLVKYAISHQLVGY